MTDFARLLETEIPRLRRYARALTRDACRADDLVQSCLLRAVAKLASLVVVENSRVSERWLLGRSG